MTRLTEYSAYADAQTFFSSEKLWELFEGDRKRLNIAYECVDRHVASKQTAVIVVRADGADEVITYQELSQRSAQVAHFLQARGVRPGDRVAVMLEPSLAFYASIFGIIKAGAIAVPLFTLFGPDGLRLRLQDCSPALLEASTASHIVGALRELPRDDEEDACNDHNQEHLCHRVR